MTTRSPPGNVWIHITGHPAHILFLTITPALSLISSSNFPLSPGHHFPTASLPGTTLLCCWLYSHITTHTDWEWCRVKWHVSSGSHTHTRTHICINTRSHNLIIQTHIECVYRCTDVYPRHWLCFSFSQVCMCVWVCGCEQREAADEFPEI